MGGGGGRGFTAHPPKTARGLQTVLLQREDFSVRNLDTDGGDEVWKVEVGRFSALDFDVDAGNNRGGGGRSSGGQDTSSSDDDILGGDAAAGGDHVVGGRRRGAAAAAASVGSKDKKKGVPPILGGRKKTSLHDFDSGFEGDRHPGGGRKESLFEHNEDDFEHDQSLFRGFPSIAFGEVSLSFCLHCVLH